MLPVTRIAEARFFEFSMIYSFCSRYQNEQPIFSGKRNISTSNYEIQDIIATPYDCSPIITKKLISLKVNMIGEC